MVLTIVAIIIVAIVIIIVVKAIGTSKRKKREAAELLQKAEQGDAQAQFAYGLLNSYWYKGIYWLQKAASQGVAEAQAELDKRLQEWEDTLKEYAFNNFYSIMACHARLTKSGYLTYSGTSDIKLYKYDFDSIYYSAHIDVYDIECKEIGNMNFCTRPHTTTHTNDTLLKFHLEGGYGYGKHMIQLDKDGVLIRSNVLSTEQPPEWLMICAEWFIEAGFTVEYPQWVEENPDAKEYVNVAFKKLGKI